MIDTTGWEYFYKVDYRGGHKVTTNMLYTPSVNSERTLMCMLWDETHPYQEENTRLTKELVDFFFEREVFHLTKFQQYDWAAKLIEVNTDSRKVFIEFTGETFNDILSNPDRSLDAECPDWKEQIFKILQDIVSAGYYKMALYPHCFFLVNGKVKTFDFYSCISKEERYIKKSIIEGLIGPESVERFETATVSGQVDFEIFFKNTLQHQLDKTWNDNPFPIFYKRLFE